MAAGCEGLAENGILNNIVPLRGTFRKEGASQLQIAKFALQYTLIILAILMIRFGWYVDFRAQICETMI